MGKEAICDTQNLMFINLVPTQPNKHKGRRRTHLFDLVLLLPNHLVLKAPNDVKIIAFPCNPHVRAAGTEAKISSPFPKRRVSKGYVLFIFPTAWNMLAYTIPWGVQMLSSLLCLDHFPNDLCCTFPNAKPFPKLTCLTWTLCWKP